ncbi:DUF1760-domain-containing protein [Aspergillus unguis]
MSSINQSISMAEEDPLIQALPPATDYLTYLTLLEYQLTPARLPILHKLLQDEVLTTNIGWDLVKILLPMLPESQECLKDVARLGNPREVILRVSDALMQLHPAEDEDDADNQLETQLEGVQTESSESNTPTKKVPLHVIKFNTLLAMLSTLHSRIQTKSPSRFVGTSLQAVLEAYTSMATNETTIALLEFLRDLSPTKRPPPPPRAPSDSTVLRVAEASAPDPEAESTTPNPVKKDEESALVRRFLQFGLVELLKSYLLSCSGPMDPGMSWAIRLQENLYPETRMPGTGSPTDVYVDNKQLGERDSIIAKITALSYDLGLTDVELLEVVTRAPETQPPPLDFEEHPNSAAEIHLERHGSLLLLASRAAVGKLFSRKASQINIYPELARIFDNFVGKFCSFDEVAFEQPQVLLDSLLALTVLSLQSPASAPANESEFTDFVLSLTACTVRQTYSTVRKIPSSVIHRNPSQVSRFKIIRKVLEDGNYGTIKDRAIDWLKDEILEAAKEPPSAESSIFLNPHYFSVLFPLLFASPALELDISELVASWVKFTQSIGPSIHSALNLYYVLVSSSQLRSQLQLEKTYVYFRNRFLEPLKAICSAFTADLTENGGDGKIEASVGEDMVKIGTARSVSLILHVVDQVEDAVSEAYVVGDTELQEPSADDIARVDAIRKETSVQ